MEQTPSSTYSLIKSPRKMFDKLLQYLRDEKPRPLQQQPVTQHSPKSPHFRQLTNPSRKTHKHQPNTHPLTTQPSSSHRDQPVNQDLDLDLKSQWFVKGQFPPRTISTKSYTTSSGWSSSGSRKSHWLVAHMRFADLSSTKIRVTWDSSSPEYTVKAEQRHSPPPPMMSRRELEDCRERYSDAIASWSESQMGLKVGNGECWTLANEALKAIAATCTSHNQEPCMASQSLVHGHVLYTYIPLRSRQPVPAGGILEAGVARGDIVQILKARFESGNGGWQTAGDPDHTAVVTGVDADGSVRVVEQNVGGKKVVMRGRYDMAEMVSGEVRIFRAVGVSWLGELSAAW